MNPCNVLDFKHIAVGKNGSKTMYSLVKNGKKPVPPIWAKELPAVAFTSKALGARTNGVMAAWKILFDPLAKAVFTHQMEQVRFESSLTHI